MLKARNLQRLFAVVSLMVSAGTACGQKNDKNFFHGEIPFKGHSGGMAISL